MATQRPVHSIHRRRVEAAIWKNTSEKGAYYRVTFSRIFSGPDGKPKTTDSFGPRELPAVALLAIEAEDWIKETEAKAKFEASSETEEVGHE